MSHADEEASTSTQTCILQCGNTCGQHDGIDGISLDKWERIRQKALEWKGLDTFGDVYEDTNWEAGPKGKFMHEKCF